MPTWVMKLSAVRAWQAAQALIFVRRGLMLHAAQLVWTHVRTQPRPTRAAGPARAAVVGTYRTLGVALVKLWQW